MLETPGFGPIYIWTEKTKSIPARIISAKEEIKMIECLR